MKESIKYLVSGITGGLFLAALYLLPATSPLIPEASAHLFGQPPFFIINGKYSNLYHVPLTSISDFPLPQDGSPDIYLVNQDLDMKFDISRLPAPPDVVKKTQFFWDFGDGSKGSGLEQHHAYKKMGSYLLSVDAFDGTTPAPQLLESVLINVLPNKNYKLPQAVIVIDDRESKDPLTDILQFPLSSPLHFDALNSTTDPSAKIVSYFWDFGDQKSSTTSTVDHTYTSAENGQIFPVLRVKDSNGFIADQFVEVKNGSGAAGGVVVRSSSQKSQGGGINFTPYVLIGAAVLLAGGVAAKAKGKRKTKGSL